MVLLAAGATVDQATNDGATPLLFVACLEGYTEIASVLLDEGGANPNQADKDGRTPLYVACRFGNKETASVLLEGGATVDQASMDRHPSTLPVSMDTRKRQGSC